MELYMSHKHLIKSLPLLASILGRKYGVLVRIGGDQAFTNGKVIQIPSLPPDGDNMLINLVRGYVDHESAHIRDTDFAALQSAHLTPFEKYVWNTLEDWRVENVLAKIYPGCRDNFRWLIKHLFLPSTGESDNPVTHDPAMQVLSWLLLTVRSWDVHALAEERERLRAEVEQQYPGLPCDIDPILQQISTQCRNTQEAISQAQTITAAIKGYLRESTPSLQANPAKQNIRKLDALLKADEDCFPDDLSRQLREKLSTLSSPDASGIQVAIPVKKPLTEFSDYDKSESRRVTTALRVQLQSLLQSTRLTRNRSGYSGKLNTQKLHTLATGNTRLFLKRGERAGVNTAVHVLLDSSGSMNDGQMRLASKASYSLASALTSIKGISVGITTFPGGRYGGSEGGLRHGQTVAPILRHGEPLHSRFNVSASGSTPMDSALWWTMQQMHSLPETRKLILLITDGEPDDQERTREALKAIRTFGMEVYGIGIATQSIEKILPDNSTSIALIGELAPAMFSILRKALLSRSSA